jgi:4-phytase/acid phosphatase
LFFPSLDFLYVVVPAAADHPAEIRACISASTRAKPTKRLVARRSLLIALWCALSAGRVVCAQIPNPPAVNSAAAKDDDLKLVVIVSRHGVRSPTGKTDQLNRYSSQPWPVWSVPPGYLTEHGAKLMTLFGAYDREQLAAQGLLATGGCADAEHIRIIADSDQRTRETGKALLQGLAPGCAIEVTALPEGTADPLFHSLGAGVGHPDKSLATAAISGRIGANPSGLTEAYRPQLEALEKVLRGCAGDTACANAAAPAPQSLFDIPASMAPGKGDHLVELQTPIGIASTMAENMLLEYAEGMDAANVGWGRVDMHTLREILQLHTAHEDLTARPSYIARAQASNLLFHVLKSIEQATQDHSVAGALTKPDDRVLILVGHDTNLASIGGALHLTGLTAGRRDDTPPGGALVFALWKSRGTKEFSVRAFYTAQTLDQMHGSTPLSLANPPERVALWVPGCSRTNSSCDWKAFKQAVQEGIDTQFVK